MKTKPRQDKVNIVTLGCAKNLVDSEVMLTQLRANQIEVEHESSNPANVIIINTCGFIDNAKQESIDAILQYAELKNEGKIDKLYVTGCLSQRYRDELEAEMPEVDAFFGTMELPSLLRRFNADYRQELVGERVTTTARHFAYLKISEGCDRPCSFCAIPLMRGGHRSKPVEVLVKEAAGLARQGVKELLLIAQDSTYYGLDLYGKRKLADLMRALSDVEGIEWIRLHYAFPSGFPKDVLQVMAERENICNYLDIPLQHGATSMLRLMRRGITRPKTEQLIHTIRDTVPNIAIRTTLIAGHPGEDLAAHEEQMKFVESIEFDRLGVFTYSHEEKTHSYTMADDVPEKEKERRAEEIMSLQSQISAVKNEKRIGKQLKVLIDRKEQGAYFGRTEYDSPEVDNEVVIDAHQYFLRVGDFAQVEITGAEPFDLYGKPMVNSYVE